MPLWLSFNTVTHSFTGTPGANDFGVADIRVTATDAASASANDVFRLFVAVPVNGIASDDSLSGGAGFDILNGFAGNDTLNGGSGNDLLTGGTGNDTYVVDGLGDVVTELADEGTDTIETTIGYTLASLANVENLTLVGDVAINGTGNLADNLLVGNSAANTLSGDAGNDTLDGGAGADTMIGGDGSDTYTVDHAGDLVTETDADLVTGGTDTAYSALSAYTLTTNVENLRLLSGGVASGTGNSLNNTLTGGAGDNVLDGGAGADVLIGGTGNDTYVVDGLSDVVTELAGEGTDTIQAGITYTLASLANVENLTLTDVAAIDGTGNVANNLLVGNSAANRLSGDSGNDTLVGGLGADSLHGGAGSDTLDYSDMSGAVTAELWRGTISNDGSGAVDTFTGIENLTGGVNADLLSGDMQANRLEGGAGNDRIFGQEGNDVLVGGVGSDNLYGGAGSDTFDFDALPESVVGSGRDVIADFNAAQFDRIDLSTIDANAILAGDQAFTFMAGAAFTNVAGQLRFSGGILSGDVNADGLADFEIQLVGVGSLVAADCLL